MSSSSYKHFKKERATNDAQNPLIKKAARATGISAKELSREVFLRSEDWYTRDFSYPELLSIAEELKKRKFLR